MTSRSPVTSHRLTSAARCISCLVLGLLGACTTGQLAPAPESFHGLPAPLSGPGVPSLSEDLRHEVGLGWSELAANDTIAARRRATIAGSTAAGRLLDLQVAVVTSDRSPLEGLVELAAEYPGYAAARATLSIAAERAGDEPTALNEARRTAALWPVATWTGRAEELGRRWIDDRIQKAQQELADGRAETALEAVEAVLALEARNLEALLLRGRSLIALDRVAEARALLTSLGSAPRAVEILGSLAELDSDWLTAMEHYQALPESWPGRRAALERVQLRWRLSVLPTYVQEALAAPQLTRAQLAALLVAMTPQLEAVEGGSVPLITDVVGLPMQREILTVVRLELLDSDPLERRFEPGRTVGPREARAALEGLSHLLALAEPVWCDESGVISSQCIHLEAPVSGEAIAATVLQLVQESRP